MRESLLPGRPLGAAALLLLAAAACERVPADSPAAAPETDPIVLEAADVRLLGAPDQVATVRDLEPAADGTVWILDSAEPLFVGLGGDGAVAAAHGALGGGPDEFGGPAGFVAGGIDGDAWVLDAPRHVLVRVSRPDDGRAEIAIPGDAVPPGSLLPGIDLGISELVRTARAGEEVILPRRSSPPAAPGRAGVYTFWLSAWTADLVAFDPATDSVRVVVALADVLGDPTPHFDLSAAFLPFPLWHRLWAVCGGDGIAVHDRLRNAVRRFGVDGAELGSTPLPAPSVTALPQREFARLTFPLAVIEAAPAIDGGVPQVSAADSARIMEGLLERSTGSPEQLANLLPRYLDMRCDDEGTVWLQPFLPAGGGLEGGPLWLRIEEDGTSREVRLPDRFDPLRFAGGRIWGVQRDELDVASVAWIAAPARR